MTGLRVSQRGALRGSTVNVSRICQAQNIVVVHGLQPTMGNKSEGRDGQKNMARTLTASGTEYSRMFGFKNNDHTELSTHEPEVQIYLK